MIELYLAIEIEVMSDSSSCVFCLSSSMSPLVLVVASGSAYVNLELAQATILLSHRTRFHGCEVLLIGDGRPDFDSTAFLT